MAKSAFDFTDVFQDIENKIDNFMKAEITRDIAAHMVANASVELVYKEYSPTEYERRKSAGGIRDARNYEVESTGRMELMVSNNTPGNPQYATDDGSSWDSGFINDIIENGTGYHWRRSRIYRSQPYPRPFMEKGVDKFVDDYLLPSIHDTFFND